MVNKGFKKSDLPQFTLKIHERELTPLHLSALMYVDTVFEDLDLTNLTVKISNKIFDETLI